MKILKDEATEKLTDKKKRELQTPSRQSPAQYVEDTVKTIVAKQKGKSTKSNELTAVRIGDKVLQPSELLAVFAKSTTFKLS